MAKLVFFLIVIFSVFSSAVQSSVALASEAPAPEEEPWGSRKSSPRPKRVRCRVPFYKSCRVIGFNCPWSCPFDCQVDCALCRPVCRCDYPGAVCQDPRFVGGDGNTFYFHGQKDKDFCIVSDTDLHINAHFIGKRNRNLTRDFTWVQSIGVIFGSHKLLIAAKRASTWDGKIDHLSVSLDDVTVNLPTSEGYMWHSHTVPSVSFTRQGPTNGVVVEVEGKFKVNAVVVPITADDSKVHGYNITSDDCFAHLELGFKFYSLTDSVDGVLGQTYRRGYITPTKVESLMPVMGGMRKYLSSGLFTTDCVVSRFGHHIPSNIINDNNMIVHSKCTSMEGTGIVCK